LGGAWATLDAGKKALPNNRKQHDAKGKEDDGKEELSKRVFQTAEGCQACMLAMIRHHQRKIAATDL
jgi:hypothetical protein